MYHETFAIKPTPIQMASILLHLRSPRSNCSSCSYQICREDAEFALAKNLCIDPCHSWRRAAKNSIFTTPPACFHTKRDLEVLDLA